MFIQYRPWLACDRHCDFCYIKEEDRHASAEERRHSLMTLAGIMHEYNVGFDTMGLIGGELFPDDECYREWFCVAETIRHEDNIRRVFVASHLLGDIDALLDFVSMVNNKEVQVCTSYDTIGRFKDEKEYEKWVSNVKEVQKEGYKVVVSTTISDAFMHDDFNRIPAGVDFKLQPLFVSEEWLEDIARRISTPQEYSAELRLNVKGLPKRADVLKWYSEHPEIAKDFATYDNKHATQLMDNTPNHGYTCKRFIPTTITAPCGHPYLAYCYGDSDKCAMCDAREVGSL